MLKKAETSRSAAPFGTGTILLVEDEAMVRNITAQFLEMAGYEVLQAGDGQEALEIADRHKEKIDLVITDVVMPRMGGRTGRASG